MACGGCARGLERHVSRLPGVNSVGVHHLTASILIDWDGPRLSIADITLAVSAAGYTLIDRHRPDELSAIMSADISRLSLRLAVAVMSGMWSMALAIVLYVTVLDPSAAWWVAFGSGILALPVIVWSGAEIFWMAFRSIRLRTPGMDLLVALGAGGAFLLSCFSLFAGSSHVYFDTATMLITLLLIGRLVDLMTRQSAIEALKAIEGISLETVVRRSSAGDQSVPATESGIGDKIVVDAGSTIGMDGVIEEGQSLVNRAVLTGESGAIKVCVGQRVEAGSINLQHRIVVAIDRRYGDRDIDRMGGAVALELAQRGATTSRAEEIAATLSWSIPCLALITTMVLPMAGISATESAIRGLTVLAAACPCALSIAGPLAQARAAGIAATFSLRLRDPIAFSALAHITTVIFDKTGTLTTGRPTVVEVYPSEGWTQDEILRLAARAETGIDHPLARAIVARHGCEEGKGGTRLERSAEGSNWDGRRITVSGLNTNDGLTSLAVTLDGELVGRLSVADAPTDEARMTVHRLRDSNIDVWIASGDAVGPTMKVAAELGIPARRAVFGCTPADKVKLIKAVPGPVLFVGDGVNDAPGLVAADCGVSVAEAHGAAAHTADVVIVKGGISQILTAIALSSRMGTIAKQNLVLAIAYNLIAVPFAITGILTPSMAALAMFASSLSVALNSIRLKLLPQTRR